MKRIERYIKILEQSQNVNTASGNADIMVDHVRLFEDGFLANLYGGDNNSIQVTTENKITLHDIVITPKGVLALIEWKKLLKENTLKHKILQKIEKPMLIIFGFSLPYLKSFLNWLF